MPKKQTFLDEPPESSEKRHLRIVITDSISGNKTNLIPDAAPKYALKRL